MVRRVVTGTNAHGKPVFSDDSTLSARTASALPGVAMYYAWGADELDGQLPRDGSQPSWQSHFPPLGGVRFVVLDLQPGQAAAPIDDPAQEQLDELNEAFPGLLGTIEPATSGMHTSATIDFAVVVSGRITLELSDTLTKDLEAGDLVVQAGVPHRWVNRGATPATVVAFLAGARLGGSEPGA